MTTNHHHRRHVSSSRVDGGSQSISSFPSSSSQPSSSSSSSSKGNKRSRFSYTNNGTTSSSSSNYVHMVASIWSAILHSPNIIPYTFILVFVVVTLQLTMNSILHRGSGGAGSTTTGSIFHSANFLRSSSHTTTTTTTAVQRQIEDLQQRISNLESKANVYVEGYEYVDNDNGSDNDNDSEVDKNSHQTQQQQPKEETTTTTTKTKKQKKVYTSKFFPFVIRDSRHLVPTQTSSEFHIFDYVDITQAKQARAVHAQLFHNAYLVDKAPCQKYTIECYHQKILQVFEYVLQNFPTVEYYFYVEADNDLCVPMTQIRDLALTEQRYFINTGIGFSGWIMSRQFMNDFMDLYKNLETKPNRTEIAEMGSRSAQAELRPDVIASYYLTERHAWAVTRQYLVSHTTLESLGAASLTVKDRRSDNTGKRLKLDKHLPRCLEPRRGKWKIRRKPLDPRDRFGWDYFDYDVCPTSMIFPCGGPNQLAELVAEDWSIANATGALEKEARLAAAAAAKQGDADHADRPGDRRRHLYHGGHRNRVLPSGDGGDEDRANDDGGGGGNEERAPEERLQSMIGDQDSGNTELVNMWKESQYRKREARRQQEQQQKQPKMHKKNPVGTVEHKHV